MAHELGAAHGPNRKRVPDRRISRIVEEVAREYGVDPGLVRGPSRRVKLREARHEAWRRLAGPDVSIISIARAWPCHHTSILNGLGRIQKAKRSGSEAHES